MVGEKYLTLQEIWSMMEILNVGLLSVIGSERDDRNIIYLSYLSHQSKIDAYNFLHI